MRARFVELATALVDPAFRQERRTRVAAEALARLAPPVHVPCVVPAAPPPAAQETRGQAIAPPTTQRAQPIMDASAGDVEAVVDAPWAWAPAVRARIARWVAMQRWAPPDVEPAHGGQTVHQRSIRGSVAGARAELQVRSTRDERGVLHGGVRLTVGGQRHHVVDLSPEALRLLERDLGQLRRALADEAGRAAARAP